LRRFGLKEFSFLHALLISLLLHGLAAVSFVSFATTDSSDIILDSIPGKARMRFSFPVRRSGIGNAKSDNEQKQEDEGEDSAQVDPGILTGEISKIMREIDYPPLARRMGMQGTVSFQLDTDADGKVSQMVLLQSSGYDLLDRTAAERLRSWTFPFYNRRFIIPVRFVLQ